MFESEGVGGNLDIENLHNLDSLPHNLG